MIASIPQDPNWWPHRYDPIRDEVHFIEANRDDHRAAVFLTDEYLKGAKAPQAIKRKHAMLAANTAPLHFIFHSGYCCSTLLTRAFDIPGVSMGFKEPVILNDIVGWKARGSQNHSLQDVLTDALGLLARPFEKGETLIAKPSSLINVIAPQVMQLRPDTKALVLYAPLEDFLGSIARKGMWGRLWVRDLMSKQLRDGMIDLGLEGDDYIRLTDLQTAAVVWLAQQSLFMSLHQTLGRERVIAVDSTTLMKSPERIMMQISDHFSLNIEAQKINEIVSGPVFTRHSKTNADFDGTSRETNRTSGQTLHAEEIEKVFTWAKIVASNARIPLILS
ncbi:MAG: hypothetical protein ACSHX3_04090 [Litorimonas sp.]